MQRHVVLWITDFNKGLIHVVLVIVLGYLIVSVFADYATDTFQLFLYHCSEFFKRYIQELTINFIWTWIHSIGLKFIRLIIKSGAPVLAISTRFSDLLMRKRSPIRGRCRSLHIVLHHSLKSLSDLARIHLFPEIQPLQQTIDLITNDIRPYTTLLASFYPELSLLHSQKLPEILGETVH